jgi:predicted amidohydrolase YtcJ
VESGDRARQAPGAGAKAGQAPEEEDHCKDRSKVPPQEDSQIQEEVESAVALIVRLGWALLAAAACTSASQTDQAREPADLVLHHAAVYTADAARSWASAVAVRERSITYVGSDSLPPGLVGPGTEVVDLRGKMVLPGFQDGHVHPIDSGVELGDCTLYDLTTPAAIVDSIRACARAHPDWSWVRGGGWQLPVFADGNPSRQLLDQAVPDRPTLLYAADGHSAWVNSKALALARVTRQTSDPANGRIERDPRTREPSGTLREDAIELVANIVPARTDGELLAGLDRAQNLANWFGITSVFSASTDEASLRTYAEADRKGDLRLRVIAAIHLPDPLAVSMLPKLEDLRARYASPRVRPIAVKLFADGVIESRTAALLAPYGDRKGDTGKPIYDPDSLKDLAVALDREGFQIHVHAIGDRAIRMTLDAFAYARARNGGHDARHTITHLELIDPDDITRFRVLGAVANFQALWANGDEYLTKMTEPTLGLRRSRWLYPIATMVRTGAVVSGGSDWSVSSLNPLDAIEMGITHRQPGQRSQRPWNPDERVDLATMIAMYTINAAYQLHQERETGSIEVGKLADLIVLDRNLFEAPVEEIHTVRVLRTLLEGKTVYADTAGVSR